MGDPKSLSRDRFSAEVKAFSSLNELYNQAELCRGHFEKAGLALPPPLVRFFERGDPSTEDAAVAPEPVKKKPAASSPKPKKENRGNLKRIPALTSQQAAIKLHATRRGGKPVVQSFSGEPDVTVELDASEEDTEGPSDGDRDLNDLTLKAVREAESLPASKRETDSEVSMASVTDWVYSRIFTCPKCSISGIRLRRRRDADLDKDSWYHVRESGPPCKLRISHYRIKPEAGYSPSS